MLHAMIHKYPTLRFLFDRLNKSSKTVPATVHIELLYDGKRKYIHTGVRVFKNEWSEKNKVVNRLDSLELNKSMDILYTKIKRWIVDLQDREEEFTFEKLDSFLECKESSCFIEFMRNRIKERTISNSTKKQHFVCLKKLEEFGLIVKFSDLTTKNVILFDDYLRKTLSHQPTIHGYHKRLKTYISDAIQRGMLKDDPYVLFQVSRGSSSVRRYLTKEELESIESKDITDKSTCRIRDVFVFQCYTGLSYSDLLKFNWNECYIDGDDYFIRDVRYKTGTEYFLMILPKALEILKRYEFKLPVISNQQYNMRLKIVGGICNVSKVLTSHVARHTFATTITLSNDVPMAIVSKMLGHTKISTTEQYAKILNKNIKEQFILLKEKIKRGK